MKDLLQFAVSCKSKGAEFVNFVLLIPAVNFEESVLADIVPFATDWSFWFEGEGLSGLNLSSLLILSSKSNEISCSDNCWAESSLLSLLRVSTSGDLEDLDFSPMTLRPAIELLVGLESGISSDNGVKIRISSPCWVGLSLGVDVKQGWTERDSVELRWAEGGGGVEPGPAGVGGVGEEGLAEGGGGLESGPAGGGGGEEGWAGVGGRVELGPAGSGGVVEGWAGGDGVEQLLSICVELPLKNDYL